MTSNDGVLEGTVSKSAKDGVLTFDDLRYSSSGNYIITATASSTSDSDSSDSFQVVEAEETISIIFPDTIMQNTASAIKVKVTDQFEVNWLDTLYMTISIDTIEQDITVESGSYSGTLTVLNTGSFTLTVKDINSNNKLTQEVTVSSRSLSVVNTYTGEYDSTLPFQVTVLTGNLEATLVTLDLYCDTDTDPNTKCSGGKMKKYNSETIVSKLTSSGSGAIYFGPFTIVSSGTFKFQATTDGYPSARSSSSVTISNKFSKLNATFTKTSISTYNDIKLTVEAYGEDEELYIQDLNITINYEPKTSSLNDYSVVTNEGGFAKTVYFIQNNSNAYYVLTCDKSNEEYKSKSLNVKPNTFYLDYDTEWLPTNTKQSFKFDLYVKDYEGKSTIERDFDVRFSVDPDADIDGKQEKVTADNGMVTIDDLIVSESGTYKLKIDCDSCETYTSEEFKINSTSCRLGGGPFGCMAVLIFFIILCTFLFYCSDRKIEHYREMKISNFWYKFLLIHPFIAIFIRQPRNRRILIALQLFTAELLMLTLIGAIYAYYDSPIERYEKSFTDYYARQLYKGGTGWALAQAGIIPIFFLSFYSIGYSELRKYTVTVCIIITVLCFGAIVGMTIKYCIGYSVYWTANFLIYVLFDVVLMQFIYTLVAICLMPKKVADALAPAFKHADMTEEIKNELQGNKKSKRSENDEDDDDN